MIAMKNAAFESASPNFRRAVEDHVVDLWCMGLDTKDISARIGRPEAWCHKIISTWREHKIKYSKNRSAS
jgi:hypothetical protein